MGASTWREIGPGIAHVKLPIGSDVMAVLEAYRNDPSVDYAEPNYLVRKAETLPTDTRFGEQWGLRNTGQTVSGVAGVAGADIGVTRAWDLHRGDGSVIVATVDTGVDYNHPDLAANIWTNPNEVAGNSIDDDGNGKVDDVHGWNFARNSNDPMDDDIDGHGTHVAGIIGAVGNNGLGVSGVNWSVRIMPLKFLDADGYGDIADAVAAMYYAIDHGARIINASYTSPQRCILDTPSTAEREAIAAAGRAGVLVVAAAGNFRCDNEKTPFYPASHALNNIVSVAATDAFDNLASFSNAGANSVLLAAPGVNIFSTVRQGLVVNNRPVDYNTISGTSMATPMVSGVLALLASYRPGLSAGELRETVLKSVDAKTSLADKTLSQGRLNADAALRLDLPSQTPFQAGFIQANAVGDNRIDLSWLDNSTHEQGYHVERRIGSAPDFTRLDMLAANSQSYSDSQVQLAEGSAYRYRVVAYNAHGDSPPSREAVITIPLLAPNGLSSEVQYNQVRLRWTDRSQAEQGYQISRREDYGLYQVIGTTAANATEFVDHGVRANTRYYYQVRAISDVVGNSMAASELMVLTPGTPLTVESRDPVLPGQMCLFTAALGANHPALPPIRTARDWVANRSTLGRHLIAFYYRVSTRLLWWWKGRA